MSEDAEIEDKVERRGWTAIGVGESPHAPAFVYTIGLCEKLAHPELIVFGLPNPTAMEIVVAVIDGIRAGRVYTPPGRYADVLEGREIGTRAVHPSQHEVYLGYAMAYYRRRGDPSRLEAMQMLWPDKSGRLPTDPRCDAIASFLQPPLHIPHVRDG